MSDELLCYRCGTSLAALSLPLSRRDQCPSCAAFLHVCRMCLHFDPWVARQCREDDAEEVTDKETANFCDWFGPRADAYDGNRAESEAVAREQLAALFGEPEADREDPDPQRPDAEDLFR